MKNFIARYWLPFFFYILFLILLSTRPGDSLPPLFPFADKIIHFGLYVGLALVFGRLLFNFFGIQNFKVLASLSLGFCFLYGLFDEALQSFIPGRAVEWLDIAADLSGGLFGCFLLFGYRRWKNLRSTKSPR